MSRFDDPEWQAGAERHLKKNIIHNILQAVRLKALGYYLDDRGHHVRPGANDVAGLSEYYRDVAMREGENLLRHVASNINPDIGDG